MAVLALNTGNLIFSAFQAKILAENTKLLELLLFECMHTAQAPNTGVEKMFVETKLCKLADSSPGPKIEVLIT